MKPFSNYQKRKNLLLSHCGVNKFLAQNLILVIKLWFRTDNVVVGMVVGHREAHGGKNSTE